MPERTQYAVPVGIPTRIRCAVSSTAVPVHVPVVTYYLLYSSDARRAAARAPALLLAATSSTLPRGSLLPTAPHGLPSTEQ